MSRMSLCMERLSKTFPGWAPAVRTAAKRISRFNALKSIVFCIGNGFAFKNNFTGLKIELFSFILFSEEDVPGFFSGFPLLRDSRYHLRYLLHFRQSLNI